MNNYKTLAESYYNTFYSTKGNISFLDKSALLFTISLLLFVYSSIVFITNMFRVDFLYSATIASFFDGIFGSEYRGAALATTMFSIELVMICLSLSFQMKKTSIIKLKLYKKLLIPLDKKEEIFKQKWLCRTFSCFPHELAEKADKIYRQIEISKNLSRTESFSMRIFLDLLYSKDSKPRVIGLFVAFISLSIALFISKSNNLKIDYLFSLLEWSALLNIFTASFTSIGLIWFVLSMILFIREFFVSKSDKTKLLVSDMLALNEINIVRV
jgi:hypothetical protein